jgi:DHA1 family tetracycline resistance protein-like MFS transporter
VAQAVRQNRFGRGNSTDSVTAGATVPAEPRKAAIAFIFVTVVVDVLAMGVVIPVLPKLVEDFMAGDTARAAAIYGVFGTVWALMQFICSPILGSLSDHVGRRPVILISCLGLGLDYVFMALAPTLGWLFVGRVISGITSASMATAFAYIADVTPMEKRAASFGIMGAAFGLGFVLGPALGGLLGSVDPRLPFWASAGLALANTLYGFFVLPESLPPNRRSAFSWRKANPLGSFELLRSHHELFGLAGVATLYYLAHTVLPSMFVLYAGYRYAWGPRTVGITLAIVGVCSMIVQGGLVKPLVARFGERTTLLAGLTAGTVGFTAYALATSGHMIWAFTPVLACMGIFGPSLQALMSKRVQPHEQGKLQGANASIMGITGMVGPAIFTQSFSRAITPGSGMHVPGAPFFLAGALVFMALILALRVTR